MHDNNSAPDNAVDAARRAGRTAPRRRFHERVAVAAIADGYAVRLDDKPVRTPAGNVLAAPKSELAQALAAEWSAQREVIDPAAMPLTRLANAIIDGVSERPGPVAAEVEKYLASDLVCYRASGPQGLVERQQCHWDPILNWAREALGAQLHLSEGVVHISQPEAALSAACSAIPREPWRLGAVHALTTLTGSALIALAVAYGRLPPDAAWQAANVDEDWNIEQWGRDDLATERRTYRFSEFEAAAMVLRELGN